MSNGYLLEFEQLARVLHVLVERPDARKLDRGFLIEATGLTDRHIEGVVSIGAAMGLIRAGAQVLTPVGTVIAKHDIFMESRASLEWCHYIAAGSAKNLVWFEIFNTILPRERTMTVPEWTQILREQLVGQYTEATLKKNLREIRFVVDAYLKRNFSRLELLQQTSDGRLYRRRYLKPTPAIFAAMIYDFAASQSLSLVQVGSLSSTLGSPAILFAMDEETVRQNLESLHLRGWLRYESTHNLNQIRLKEGLDAMEFLSAHFEQREPNAKPEPMKGNTELPLT